MNSNLKDRRIQNSDIMSKMLDKYRDQFLKDEVSQRKQLTREYYESMLKELGEK